MARRIQQGGSRPLKICYLIDYLFSVNGGTERQLYLLITGMLSRGHRVELVVLRHTEFTRNLRDFPCPVHCAEIQSLLSAASLPRMVALRRRLLEGKFDVVHGFFNDTAMLLPLLSVGSPWKVYTSRRDMGIWYTRARLYLLRLLARTQVRVICNSQAVSDYTCAMEGISRARIRVIHNGLGPVPLGGEDVVNECAAIRARITGKALKVVTVANVRPVKNLEDLILAAGHVVKECPSSLFLVAGHISDPAYHRSLMAMIRDLNLESHFEFIGPVKEPRHWLGNFDIGVLTSSSEGFSNTLMEYLEAGLPAVATKVGGNSELIDHGETGYLYEPGRPRELADYLLRIWRDDGVRASLKVSSREASRRFTLDFMLGRYEEEYAL